MDEILTLQDLGNLVFSCVLVICFVLGFMSGNQR